MVLYFYEFIMHNKIRWATLAGLKKKIEKTFASRQEKEREVLQENEKNKRESKKLIYVFVEIPLIFSLKIKSGSWAAAKAGRECV